MQRAFIVVLSLTFGAVSSGQNRTDSPLYKSWAEQQLLSSCSAELRTAFDEPVHDQMETAAATLDAYFARGGSVDLTHILKVIRVPSHHALSAARRGGREFGGVVSPQCSALVADVVVGGDERVYRRVHRLLRKSAARAILVDVAFLRYKLAQQAAANATDCRNPFNETEFCKNQRRAAAISPAAQTGKATFSSSPGGIGIEIMKEAPLVGGAFREIDRHNREKESVFKEAFPEGKEKPSGSPSPSREKDPPE